MPSTPTSTFQSRPSIGASSVTSVMSPKSVMYREPPWKTQLSGTPPVSRKSLIVPSGARMSTPPAMNAVTHRSPFAATLSPSGMWPSGSWAICSTGPPSRLR